MKKMADPGCDALHLNLEKGTLNGIPATASWEQIKTQFPCSTGETEEGAAFNCGGGVFFLNHDFYFYTHRDYIEVRTDFKGTISPLSMQMTRSEVMSVYGNPEQQPDPDTYYYQKKYGTVRVEFSDNRVKEIGVHAQPMEAIILCR
jgi:hypothetical protein